jgi:putative flippase GtrA
MQQLLNVKGERFEFEMRMLLEAAAAYPVREVPVETIYESKEHHQTHFRPLWDSIKIYRILAERFVRFLFASLSSSVLDLVLFSVLCGLLKDRYPLMYAGISTVGARIISAVYNYLINYKVVFKSQANIWKASIKYALLAVVLMSCSAAAITVVMYLFPSGPRLLFKILIDMALFFVSYSVQQKMVFRR